MIFLDTCILIDNSKGKITDISENQADYCISSIVQLEFIVGALNKRELQKINQIISKFEIIETDQSILNLSTQLVNQYTLSHNMAIYDSIIAATCLTYDIPLWTYNKKDFIYIDDLKLVN